MLAAELAWWRSCAGAADEPADSNSVHARCATTGLVVPLGLYAMQLNYWFLGFGFATPDERTFDAATEHDYMLVDMANMRDEEAQLRQDLQQFFHFAEEFPSDKDSERRRGLSSTTSSTASTSTSTSTSGVLSEGMRRELEQFYRPHNEALLELMNSGKVVVSGAETGWAWLPERPMMN
jgi:hypothetical protein